MGLWTLAIFAELRTSFRWFRDITCLPKPISECDGNLIVLHSGQCVIAFMSTTTRWLIYFFAVLPKFLIAMVTWWIGCRWLASTPAFDNLILNSCALSFILGVDEILYTAIQRKK